jgi:hypothetical protein
MDGPCSDGGAEFEPSNCFTSRFRHRVAEVTKALSLIDDRELVLYLLMPFDQSFSAHPFSLFFKGVICEREDSLLTLSSKVHVVFAVTTLITKSKEILIPAFTF